MARSTWTIEETDILIDNYSEKTIVEFCEIFPDRSKKSIQRKIAQLQAEGAMKYKYNSKNAKNAENSDNDYFSPRKNSSLKGDW